METELQPIMGWGVFLLIPQPKTDGNTITYVILVISMASWYTLARNDINDL
jgi:hypothetical protein